MNLQDAADRLSLCRVRLLQPRNDLMSASALEVVRWILLANAGICVLVATVFLRPWVALVERVWRTGKSPDSRVPRNLRVEAQRVWFWTLAILFVAAWWYLGTPGGAGAVMRLS